MRSIRIKFPNANGQQLAAKLDMPLGKRPKAYALFAHCFTCSANLNAVRNISLGLTQAGIAVFRFDFTGLGQSEGSFAETNFSTNLADLVAAAEYLKTEWEAPSLLMGHSLGGAAALAVARQLSEVEAVVTIGSPADPEHVLHLLDEQEEEIVAKGEATVHIGGRPFRLKKQFIDDLKNTSKDHIRTLGKSLLVMHSPQDQVVGIENAATIYELARHPKSFISLDGADHLMSQKEDATYVGQVVAGWASRYLTLNEPEALVTDKEVGVRTGAEGYTTEIKAGGHTLFADEPEDVGGLDLGPSPYGLLAAALGACTSMTLRMYADRKKWDLQEVRVHLNHAKDYLADSEHSEDAKSKIDVFEREIELEGKLDHDQRQRLLEIADRCPVHRTLHGDIHVRTHLKS